MTTSGTAAIEAHGIHKGYGGEAPALDGFDLRVQAGTVCALLGRNGAGKTTAVRIMTTLLRADAGTVAVAGYDVAAQGDQVRGSVGLVGQYAAVDDVLSGRKNLVLFGRLQGLTGPAARARADELLEQFRLGDAADRAVGTYSGGMRRRLDLAVSLVVSPRVLFVDEPTTGLDLEARMDMWAALRDLVAGGATLLLTTQYLAEAEGLADHVAMLRNGRVVLEGTPAELTSLVGDTWVEFALSSPDDARLAARVAQPFAVRAVDGLAAGTPATSVAVPVATRASVTALCAALAAAGIEPLDLAIRRPSLDDVFVHVNRADGAHDDNTPEVQR